MIKFKISFHDFTSYGELKLAQFKYCYEGIFNDITEVLNFVFELKKYLKEKDGIDYPVTIQTTDHVPTTIF